MPTGASSGSAPSSDVDVHHRRMPSNMAREHFVSERQPVRGCRKSATLQPIAEESLLPTGTPERITEDKKTFEGSQDTQQVPKTRSRLPQQRRLGKKGLEQLQRTRQGEQHVSSERKQRSVAGFVSATGFRVVSNSPKGSSIEQPVKQPVPALVDAGGFGGRCMEHSRVASTAHQLRKQLHLATTTVVPKVNPPTRPVTTSPGPEIFHDRTGKARRCHGSPAQLPSCGGTQQSPGLHIGRALRGPRPSSQDRPSAPAQRMAGEGASIAWLVWFRDRHGGAGESPITA